MAITIAANLAKKLPIPGTDYSSQQASITITAEVSDLSQVVAEAQRLYALAEQAVDAQLNARPTQAPTRPHTPAGPSATGPAPASTQRSTPASASRPYQGGQRRGPAPVTDSQLRYLQKLITDTSTSLPAILEHHQVGSLRDLSCKCAAGLIDELKSRVPA